MTNYSAALLRMQTGPATASLDLTPNWLQGRTAYGGWQAALAVCAMRQIIGPDIPLRSLQANFIAPIGLGLITATAELLRQGKSAAQIEARICVDGKVAFAAVGIFGLARPSAIAEQPQAGAVVLPDTLTDRAYLDGAMPQFLQNFDMRWAAGAPPFSGTPHSESKIYARFRDEHITSEAHLICIADVIPPSAISMLSAPAMISSMNWTLEMISPLNDSETRGWLRFDSALTAAGDGYGWENTSIWSDQGKLIALSRQCVALFG